MRRRPRDPVHGEQLTDIAGISLADPPLSRVGDMSFEADSRFHHATLFYSGDHGFLRGTLPFISEGLAAEEPILVAVASARIELLREALGREAEFVRFVDMRVLGHNPARIIPAWHQFLEDHPSDGGSVRGIGEPIWPGRSPAELTECHRHESLLNVAFDQGRAWRLLCPYDLDGLDEATIEAARRSHPFIAQESGSRASDAYLHADMGPGPFHGSLPPPRAPAAQLVFGGDQLAGLRELLSGWASDFQLGAERTQYLVLAANELASNSVRHGGGGGTLRIWKEEQTLLVEVHDRGHISEPLIGRERPAPEQPNGRGMWLAHQLCDLVQIRSDDAGNVVRLHMHLP
jgi:anti-sigma regulatory factor (Ser/Thr protein kinase)